MNVQFSNASASCLISTPWTDPSEDSQTYACVNIIQPTSATRNRSPQPRHGPRLSVTLYTTAVLPPSSSSPSSSIAPPINLSKCFRRIYSVRKSLRRSDDGNAQLLGVFNALDISLQLFFSYVVVASTLSDCATLTVFRIEQSDVVLVCVIPVKVIKFSSLPLRVVVLRGPVFLVSQDSSLVLFKLTSSNPEHCDARTLLQSRRNEQYLAGACERDTLAVIAVVKANSAAEQTISHIRPVSFTGYVYPPLNVQHQFSTSLYHISASLHDGIVILSVRKDGAFAFDFRSCRLLWTCQMDDTPVIPFLHSRRILFAQLDGAVLSAPLPSVKSFSTIASLSESLQPTVLCSPCETVSTSPHTHFLAKWRGRLLCMNENTATCCIESVSLTDKSNTPVNNARNNASQHLTATNHHYTQQSVIMTSPLRSVGQNLRKRFDDGVDHFLTSIQKNEEKRKMLRFAVRLVADLARTPAMPSRIGVMPTRLRRVVSRFDRASMLPCNDDEERADDISSGLRLWVAGQSYLTTAKPFVNVLKLRRFLDDSESFVVVNADLELLHDGNGSRDEKAGFVLAVRIDQCMTAAWNCFISWYDGKNGKNVLHLSTAVLMADVVQAVGDLRDVHLHMSIEASDGRYQHLGSFSMSTLFSEGFQRGQRLSNQQGHGLHAFQQEVYVMLRGPGAHRLEIAPAFRISNCVSHLFGQDGLACLALKVTSGVQLATVTAKLKMLVDDSVTLSTSVKLAKSSLVPVDDALVALEDEMRYMREVVKQGDTIGFSSRQVGKLLTQQYKVDEAFGRLEEMLMAL